MCARCDAPPPLFFCSQEKPRVDVRKFVKIGRPGYKGMTASFSGSPRTQRSPSASDGKLGGVWERVYCSHEFVLLTAVTKQRDPDSGQHSLFFQVSRELNNGGTFSLIDTGLHLQPHSQTDFVVWVLDNPEILNSLLPRPFLLQTASL